MQIRSRLYALLDAGSVPTAQLLDWADAALTAGVGLLQYRDKHADRELRHARATALVARAADTRTPLLINDDVELAREVGASGVHVGRDDTPVARARARLGASAIIGATCHDKLSLAVQAVREGASYVAFGRFFPSGTKPGAPPADLSVLHRARQLGVPVVAIGGIDLTNAQQVLSAGADWLAVSGALFQTDSAEEVFRRTQAFNRLIEAFEHEDRS
ncbi:MAG: thiamine phosphate synthase [Gammaproteobacteria bacterium]|nr:MAG: thiamine phosphate synthase [Gammaproteobacteria bacterium]